MIYLDHNATTPLHPDVARAVQPILAEEFGNPSSGHDLGRRAKAAYENARQQVASLINARPSEVLFTSGGTESNNTALKGLFYRSPAPFHLVSSRIEHPAVINPALFLMTQGAEATFVHAGDDGRVDPGEVEAALKPQTRLISIMLANNETGVLQPVKQIARLARSRGVLVHTDAAQAVGKVPVDVEDLGVDFLTIAGHKLYAPKGVGALYIRRGVDIEPFMHGAGQESGRRAGTENVALAVGLGAACSLAGRRLPEEIKRLTALRERLWRGLQKEIQDAVLIGHPTKRLPNTLNVCIPGLSGAEVLERAPEIMASTGAACHAGTVQVSPVLQAMNLPPELAGGAIRLSLGAGNDEKQVDQAAAALSRAVQTLAGHA